MIQGDLKKVDSSLAAPVRRAAIQKMPLDCFFVEFMLSRAEALIAMTS